MSDATRDQFEPSSSSSSGHRQPNPRDGGSSKKLPAAGEGGEDEGTSRFKQPDFRPRQDPPVDWAATLRQFLDVTGGSILYCLSALSIIYGVAKIMGPHLVDPEALNEALPCLGVLNLYELALLGTLLFIVVLRRVNDDAISLVVMIPLFLIGGGIALDSVSGSGPGLAIGIGMTCAAVGIGKLLVLRRWIGLPMGGYAMAGLGMVVVWSFLAGPILRWIFVDCVVFPALKRELLLGSVLFLLSAGVIVLAGAVRARAREPVGGASRPFLSTVSMVLVFAMVLFAAAGAHLYALGYMFTVRYAPGDFVAIGALICILVVEVLLGSKRQLVVPAAVVSCLPLAVMLPGMAVKGFYIAPFAWGLEILGHPAFGFVVTGAYLVWAAVRTRWSNFLSIATVYACCTALTAGVDQVASDALNWRAALGLLATVLLVKGVIRRQAQHCLLSILLGALGVAADASFGRAATSVGLSYAGAVAGMVGAGWLLVIALFRNRTLYPFAICGAAALSAFAFDFVGSGVDWRDAGVLPTIVALGVLLGWRTRMLVPLLILSVPLAVRGWILFREMSDWRYVVLSFILLGLGAWRSAVKGRNAGVPVTDGSGGSAPS